VEKIHLSTNLHESTRIGEGAMKEILFKDEVYKVIGAAMEVYNELGFGFLEAVYQEALAIEMINQNIPFEIQKPLIITYKNTKLKKEYNADFFVFKKIIVEIKTEKNLVPSDEAQLLNYLKAINKRVGLLINFGNHDKLEWKRMIL
jgi:GxxExxY protein